MKMLKRLWQRSYLGCLGLLLSGFADAHPADTSDDGQVSSVELIAYASTDPDPDLFQQAQNIVRLSDSGGYLSLDVDGKTVYVPSRTDGSILAVNRYHGAPMEEVTLGMLDPTAGPYQAYGNRSDRLADYFPIALSESNGTYTVRLPLLGDSGEFNLFVHQVGQPLDDPGRKQVGSLSVQLPDPALTAGSFSALVGAIDSMTEEFERITEVDYSDYFIGGGRSLNSVADLYQRAEIEMICFLQDPNLPGGLRQTVATIQSVPELAQDVMPKLDFLASQSMGGVMNVVNQLETQFIPSDASKRKGVEKKPASKMISGDVLTARELLDGMLNAAVAESMLQESIFSPQAGAANTALSFAGVPGKVISASVGVTSAALQLRYELIANQNPSSAKLIAEFSRTEFFQDTCDMPGTWSAKARAESKRWAGDKAVFDALLNAFAAAGAASDVAQLAKGLAQAQKTKQAIDLVNEAQKVTSIDVARASAEFAAAERIKNDLGSNPNNDLITLPKREWRDIVFDKETAEMKANPSDRMSITDQEYVPTDVGSSQVIVTVKDGLYSVGVETGPAVTITTREARVVVRNCPGSFEPGQSYSIEAELLDVEDPTSAQFTWTTSAGALSPATTNNGVSTVTWTAPDPAPIAPVTITARAMQPDLCIPENAPQPEASCVTQNLGNYELTLSPDKGCYDLGETVTLTMTNLADGSEDFDVDFQLIAGVGTLLKTSKRTATFTSENTTVASVIANVVGRPTVFSTVALNYGCEPFMIEIIGAPPWNTEADPWLLAFPIGETDGIAVNVPGQVNDSGSFLEASFTPATMAASKLFQDRQQSYQNQLAAYEAQLIAFQEGGAEDPGRPPRPPESADVGVYFFDTVAEYQARFGPDSFYDGNVIYNVPTFRYAFSFEYTTTPGFGSIPGVVEVSNMNFTGTPNITAIGGPAGDYQLDAVLTGIKTVTLGATTYTLYLIPETP